MVASTSSDTMEQRLNTTLHHPAELRERNLAFLAAHASPSSTALVGGADGSDLTVRIGEQGRPEFSCRDCERQVQLHSRTAPEAEAERQLQTPLADASAGCIVLGVAGGYHLQVLADRLRPGSLLLIIDLFPDRVAAALKWIDLPSLERRGVRVAFIFNTSADIIRREFHHLIHRELNCHFAFFVHPGLWRVANPPWRLLIDELKAEIRLETSDRATRAACASTWLANAINSLQFTLRHPQINVLSHCFAGGTAIVAAAGPTLADAIPMIRRLNGCCPLIAVGTAVKPLLRAGLVPDLIVIIDGNAVTADQLPQEGVPGAFLAASYSVPASLFARFPDRLFNFSFSALSGFNRWLELGGIPPVQLNIGGTVSLTAIDVALLTGCSSVILCGLDLAMTETGETHTSGSVYDGRRLDPNALLRVPGNFADTVPTTPIFAGYIRQMNAYLDDMSRSGEIKFFNATTGGAKLEKTIVIRPEMVSREAIAHPISDAAAILRSCHDRRIAALKPDYLNDSAIELGQLAELARTIISTADDRHRRDCEERLRRLPIRCLLNQAIEAVTFNLSGNDPATQAQTLYQAIAEAAAQLQKDLDFIRTKT